MTPTTTTTPERIYSLSLEYGATPSSMIVVPATDRTEFENLEDVALKFLKPPKGNADSQHQD